MFNSKSFLLAKISTLLGALVIATGCQEEAAKVETPIRGIKTFTVTDVAEGQVRRYPGKIEAATTSALSFSVAGKVTKITVKEGARVKKDQELARLDQEPFKIALRSAQAELNKAQANFKEKDKDFRRKKDLFSKGWVARAALDQAQAARDTARSDIGYVTSKVNQAKRSMADSVLRAPFDGTIAARTVDPFNDVGIGQQVIVLNAEGALNVAITVPETTVGQLTIGMTAQIQVASGGNQTLSGRITEIASQAGQGNVFPVRISLVDRPAKLRAGMTADVALTIGATTQRSGVLIPITAISPGDKQAKGYVYVYQPQSKSLKKVAIEPRGAQDNLIAVTGVKAGDQIASAGVAFLSDGQKVKLMTWPLR